MRLIKNILLLIVLGFIVFVVMWLNNNILLKSNDLEIEEDRIVIQEEEIKEENREDLEENNEIYSISTDLSAVSEDYAIEEIYNFVKLRIFEFKNDFSFNNLTEERIQEIKSVQNVKYSLSFNVEVKDSEKVKTYLLIYSYYTGGAHGNQEKISFNYDKETNKRIYLDDFFVGEEEDYLSVLAALGDKYFFSEFGNSYFDEGLRPITENWQNWYIENDSIVFIFQTYQVVPYVYGSPEFPVVLGGVEQFVNPKFLE